MSPSVIESHVSLVYFRELVAAIQPTRLRAHVGERRSVGMRVQQSIGAALIRLGKALLRQAEVRGPVAPARELGAARPDRRVTPDFPLGRA